IEERQERAEALPHLRWRKSFEARKEICCMIHTKSAVTILRDHADGLSRRSFLTTEQRPALPHPQGLSMEKTTQSSHADEAESFVVTSDAVELPPGSSFTVRPGPIKFFELAFFLIGERLIIGRWLPDPEDGDSIWQPRRRIRITGKVPFRIVGAII